MRTVLSIIFIKKIFGVNFGQFQVIVVFLETVLLQAKLHRIFYWSIYYDLSVLGFKGNFHQFLCQELTEKKTLISKINNQEGNTYCLNLIFGYLILSLHHSSKYWGLVTPKHLAPSDVIWNKFHAFHWLRACLDQNLCHWNNCHVSLQCM